MASKLVKIVDAQVVTGAVTTNFTGVDIPDYSGFSFHVKPGGTGTLAGTVKVQVSNNNTDWQDLSGATASLSTTNGIIINCVGVYTAMCRLVIVSTAGTSTINAWVCAKE